METASGKGLNEIPPGNCFLFPAKLSLEAVRGYLPSVLNADPPEEQAAALIAGLAALGNDPEAIGAFNRLLEEIGVAARVAPPPRAK